MTPFRLAAPSCVLPLTVGAACQQLAGFVPEVALMFLETEACLAYGPEDIAFPLQTPPLVFHLHLPVDLPWDAGVSIVHQKIAALERKVASLKPHTFVLHPPAAPYLLEGILHHSPHWRNLVAMENIGGADLSAVWPVIEAQDLGVCLDVGHLVSYGQRQLLDLPGLFARTRVLHLYGGEMRGQHQPLQDFPDPDLLRQILVEVARTSRFQPVSLVLEVFSWEHFVTSRQRLGAWMEEWGLSWWS